MCQSICLWQKKKQNKNKSNETLITIFASTFPFKFKSLTKSKKMSKRERHQTLTPTAFSFSNFVLATTSVCLIHKSTITIHSLFIYPKPAQVCSNKAIKVSKRSSSLMLEGSQVHVWASNKIGTVANLEEMIHLARFGTICTISKTLKSTHGGVLIFTKIITSQCVFLRFINCKNTTKSRKASHIYYIFVVLSLLTWKRVIVSRYF